jgi:hypothetical protein
MASPLLFEERIVPLGLRCLDHSGECAWGIDSQVGQHFAIQLDVGLSQIVNQATIGRAIRSGSCINADDPKTPEIALLVASIPVSIRHGLHPTFISSPEQLMARPKEALGLLHQFLMATACYGTTFNSHNSPQ